MGELDFAIANQHVPIRRGDIDPPWYDLFTIPCVSGRQRASPLQDPGKPADGVRRNMDHNEHRSLEVRDQSLHDLPERFHSSS